ncbi:prepilin-type N-terminal cleavage/methylation domain-containing protein [Microbacterium sp. STN6]|uniref:type II secretion system protein n=1 Tax=Microbacterium sp. STN6 TaxID=2995588 RepID=UPI002260D6AB|nr:prepilin-type N-terminal cleavage/methylation domain-containing protein [Microbacterium sp. STN6]MCX7523187.1 prepilin-type N-terminal cleavage/methylation domain-containing protein [Microbacterium sp. STN6]
MSDIDRDRGSREAGYTLIELVVSMGIFSLFIALILGTTVTIAQNASRTSLIAQSSNATLAVFGSLDRQARYADSVNPAGVGPSGARYIEFRTPGNSSASGVTTCTQWRFIPGTGHIESRQWNDLPGSTASPWSTKMTGVIDDGGTNYPFSLIPASLTGSAMQQLSISIHAGNVKLNAGTNMSTTFVARNSSTQSPSNTGTLVCDALGHRP